MSNAYGYTKCKHGGTSIAPFKIWDYYKDVDAKKCIEKDANGQVVSLNFGDAHYVINDKQEVQNMDRIGQGAVE